MPSKQEISSEIARKQILSQQAIDEVRRNYLSKLAKYTERDVIFYGSAFTAQKAQPSAAKFMSINTGDMQGFMAALHGLKSQNLDLVLHSPGGSSEAAEQIVQYLRAKYSHIRAIIPQNAMSAATMMACACDEIVMGKHSALGPIDPQLMLPSPMGQLAVPAQSLLNEFEQAKAEVAQNPNLAALWVTKIQTYPHGIISVCFQTIKKAQEIVQQWLERYMFKDDPEKTQKSEKIAVWLGNANEHKAHGKPITIDVGRAHGLKITALEGDQLLQELVLSHFHATMISFENTDALKIIENQNGKGTYITQ